MIDAYKVLGISKDSDEATAKKAFRRLAKQYHPDTNSATDAEHKFKQVNEAYSILSTPERRHEHDIANGYIQPTRGRGGFDPFASHGFDDFFSDMFGHNPFADFSRHQQRGNRRKVVNLRTAISLQEVLSGGVREVMIDNQSVRLDFPPGCFQGEGMTFQSDDMDINLEFSEEPHETFRRDGVDLHGEISLSVYLAIMGGEIEVETLRGKKTIRIPAHTNSHAKIKLAHQGLTRGNRTGDLYLSTRLTIDEDSCKRLGIKNYS